MKNRMIYQVDKTREHILEISKILFTEKGFFETQIKDIALKAGISRNTVYRYFQDKSDLAMTTIERTLIELRELHKVELDSLLKNQSFNGLEKFSKAIKMTLMDPVLSGNSKLMAEFDAYYSGNRISQEVKERFLRIDASEYTEMLLKIIEEGKADRSIRTDVDSHLTLVTYMNAVRALRQRIILRGDVLIEAVPGETEKMIDLLMELMTEGLKNRSVQ